MSKVLNMGGETMAYECDSSDDESLLLPVKRPLMTTAVPDSGDETEGEGNDKPAVLDWLVCVSFLVLKNRRKLIYSLLFW